MNLSETYKICITDEDHGVHNVAFTYLLGFQPSYGIIILGEQKVSIGLDGRYFGNSSSIDESLLQSRWKQGVEIKYILLKGDPLECIFRNISSSSRIILEHTLTYAHIEKIKQHHTNLTIETPFFDISRITKQEEEKISIQKAIKIIEKVYESIEGLNQEGSLIGKSEKQVRTYIIQKIFEFGGDGESFPAIVAFGSNSALPHHCAGDNIIGTGVLLIDMGAMYQGYCSDFTRTFWVGKRGGELYEKFMHIHSIVQDAHDRAIEAIQIGKKTSEIDAVARDIIDTAGYGDLFIHSTGHGVGLHIHEAPGVGRKSEDIIQAGMVFTVEPGIYIENEFGVRVEDILIVD